MYHLYFMINQTIKVILARTIVEHFSVYCNVIFQSVHIYILISYNTVNYILSFCIFYIMDLFVLRLVLIVILIYKLSKVIDVFDIILFVIIYFLK